MKTLTSIETLTLDLGLFGEQDVNVHYAYTPGRPGRPGCQYLRNGDPGHPDEPATIEIRGVSLVEASAIQLLPQGWWDNELCKDIILDMLSTYHSED